MNNPESIITLFKEELAKRGYTSNIVWLHEPQMRLIDKILHIYVGSGFPLEENVKRAIPLLEGAPGVLMLVYIDSEFSYCTLLMDEFGSDSDIFLKEENFYLWCNPYVTSATMVTSKFKWFIKTKLFSKKQISSLDYAFQIQQSYT